MKYQKNETDGRVFIEGVIGETLIAGEGDFLEFVVHGGEHDTNRILLHEENLVEEFFDLKTGLAGAILQKLATYSVRAAIVISEARVTGRFGELVGEMRTSGALRFFTARDEAAAWLVSG